jgi:hypothetical protein
VVNGPGGVSGGTVKLLNFGNADGYDLTQYSKELAQPIGARLMMTDCFSWIAASAYPGFFLVNRQLSGRNHTVQLATRPATTFRSAPSPKCNRKWSNSSCWTDGVPRTAPQQPLSRPGCHSAPAHHNSRCDFAAIWLSDLQWC